VPSPAGEPEQAESSGTAGSLLRAFGALRRAFEQPKPESAAETFANATERREAFLGSVVKAMTNIGIADDAAARAVQRIAGPRGQPEPTEGYSVKIGGLELREGDVILQKSDDGAFWGMIGAFPANLTHMRIVVFTPDGHPFLAEMGLTPELTPLADGLCGRMAKVSCVQDIVVLRPEGIDEAKRHALRQTAASLCDSDVRYDFAFDAKDDKKLYCTEYGLKVLRSAGLASGVRPSRVPDYGHFRDNLKALGLTTTELYTPADLVRAPGFSLVGELALNQCAPRYIERLLHGALRCALAERKADCDSLHRNFAGALTGKLNRQKLDPTMPDDLSALLATVMFTDKLLARTLHENLVADGYSLTDFPRYKAEAQKRADAAAAKLVDKLFLARWWNLVPSLPVPPLAIR
jgi:hypothetical protein